MSVNAGMFFENPDSTGDYGYFEDYCDVAKIISKIAIYSPELGYVESLDENITVYDLKQQYPDAEFSYYFKDENGNDLGWLTNKSFNNK